MSSQPNHTSNLLHDPLETTIAKETEADTCPTQKQGKEGVLHEHGQEHGSSGATKKNDHNAKERLRRMRLHASYLTLGTLLPDPSSSSSSKKKWCAPSIIDRVITYIPKLQNEVEELTLIKQKLVASKRRGPSIRAISVLELEGPGYNAVVQLCIKKEKNDDFSNLLHVMEMQGLSILSASTSQVCNEERVVCYNFHVKMDKKPCEGDDYITILKNNIISSLS